MPTSKRPEKIPFNTLYPELQRFPNDVPRIESDPQDVFTLLNLGVSAARKELPVNYPISELPRFMNNEIKSRFAGIASQIDFLYRQICSGIVTNITERFRKTLEEYKIELLKLLNKPSSNNEKINGEISNRIAKIDKILNPIDEYKDAGPVVEELLKDNYTPKII